MNDVVDAPAITYEEACELARNDDPTVREALAKRGDVKPEVLYFLTGDSAVEVRRALAINAATPQKADLLLARDEDQNVRTGLAAKIAKVAPGLSSDERDKIRHSTYEALELLARDEMTRVRQILAEILKDVADAPPDVIGRLARDSELVVSGPVLEFSPVLTEADLLEIIKNGPAKGGLGAISRRANVTEGVTDAVAASDDVEAIAAMLANPSAQIREETLDTLIDRAPDHEPWHQPLVSRPRLPAGAAARLARFLADNLLEALQARDDLDAETLEAVKAVARHRLGGDGVDMGKDYPTVSQDVMEIQAPTAVVRGLFKAGKLDGKVILKALNAGDFGFVIAALAVRCDVTVATVQKIFATQSAKGIVALTWQARMPAPLAVHMQHRIARIAPREVLQAPISDEFPLGESEMTAQLEFFGDFSSKDGK